MVGVGPEELVQIYLNNKDAVVSVIDNWERLGKTRREFCECLYDAGIRTDKIDPFLRTPQDAVFIEFSSNRLSVSKYYSHMLGRTTDEERSGSYLMNPLSVSRWIELLTEAVSAVPDELQAQMIVTEASVEDGHLKIAIPIPVKDPNREPQVKALNKSLNSSYTRLKNGKEYYKLKKLGKIAALEAKKQDLIKQVDAEIAKIKKGV